MAPSARSRHSPRHARALHADRLKAALIMPLRLLVLAREIRRGGTSQMLARFMEETLPSDTAGIRRRFWRAIAATERAAARFRPPRAELGYRPPGDRAQPPP